MARSKKDTATLGEPAGRSKSYGPGEFTTPTGFYDQFVAKQDIGKGSRFGRDIFKAVLAMVMAGQAFGGGGGGQGIFGGGGGSEVGTSLTSGSSAGAEGSAGGLFDFGEYGIQDWIDLGQQGNNLYGALNGEGNSSVGGSPGGAVGAKGASGAQQETATEKAHRELLEQEALRLAEEKRQREEAAALAAQLAQFEGFAGRNA